MVLITLMISRKILIVAQVHILIVMLLVPHLLLLWIVRRDLLLLIPSTVDRCRRQWDILLIISRLGQWLLADWGLPFLVMTYLLINVMILKHWWFRGRLHTKVACRTWQVASGKWHVARWFQTKIRGWWWFCCLKSYVISWQLSICSLGEKKWRTLVKWGKIIPIPWKY